MTELVRVNESNFYRCRYTRNTHINGELRPELEGTPSNYIPGDGAFIMHMLDSNRSMTFKELLAEVVMYYYQNYDGEAYDAYTTLSLVKKIVRGINDALRADVIKAELP